MAATYQGRRQVSTRVLASVFLAVFGLILCSPSFGNWTEDFTSGKGKKSQNELSNIEKKQLEIGLKKGNLDTLENYQKHNGVITLEDDHKTISFDLAKYLSLKSKNVDYTFRLIIHFLICRNYIHLQYTMRDK